MGFRGPVLCAIICQ